MVLYGNDKTYNTVVLGAFLHDVGKFLGRGKFEILDKGQHPKFSADFVAAFSPLFQKVADVELLRMLVMKHHEDPRSFSYDLLVQSIEDRQVRTLAKLVSKADKLSSLERGKRSEQYQDYKATPMFSVLERVNRTDDAGLRLRFHLQPLIPDGRLFPAHFQVYGANEMNAALDRFGDEFRRVFKPPRSQREWLSFDQLTTHLTNVVYKYTWSLPSNTQEAVPDISLFDHLRTTAAIAACLYQYHVSTNTLEEQSVASTPEPRFLLCVGDISGIQSYIFDIATTGVGGVARRLRARSFYVQLCSEVAAIRIVRECNLPFWNLLMNSGGRFYILLPNISSALERLAVTQKKFDSWFLTHLNAELRLNLAYVAFGDEGFAAGDGGIGFGGVLANLATELGKAKQRHLATVMQDGQGWNEDAFVLALSFDGKGDCISCHKFPEQTDGLCWHCQRDLRVGALLPRSRYLAFFGAQVPESFPLLDYYVQLSDTPRFSSTPILVMQLDSVDADHIWQHPSLRKELAKHVPMVGETTLTFEDIASRSEGKPLLGYLKADVDRLGRTFVLGLKRREFSLDTVSRQATMSRLLDLFFAGWIEQLISSDFPDCYIVFSGGDDVFLAGPWHQVIQLSLRLRKAFAEFVGCPLEDSRLTLSAGIAIVKPDYPVARAAAAVEDALKMSKASGRNRVTVLGVTLTWPEWENVINEWRRLGPIVQPGKAVSSAFLYSLVRFGEMWREYAKGQNVGALRFHPLLSYNVRRNVDARRNPELASWVSQLLRWPPGDKEKKMLDGLSLLASLLLYSRKGGK